MGKIKIVIQISEENTESWADFLSLRRKSPGASLKLLDSTVQDFDGSTAFGAQREGPAFLHSSQVIPQVHGRQRFCGATMLDGWPRKHHTRGRINETR